MTYPSNKTKRFEHSLGVMDLAGRIFCSSVSNSDDRVLNSFLQEIKDSVKKWRESVSGEHLGLIVPRNSLTKYTSKSILSMPLPESAFYSRYLPEKISKRDPEDKVAYYIAFQAVRIAGLLHDVGHMPYSHILEHALKKLYKKVGRIPDNERTINHKHFIDALEAYCDPKAEDADEIHEELGKECAEKIFECIANSTEKDENNIFFVASYDFACRILQSKVSQNDIYSDLHLIIAGVFDADRLDYCCRDAFCAGTRKDIINFKRLLLTYSICIANSDEPLSEESEVPCSSRHHFYFCPDVKNVPLVEDLLYRRWDIFSMINYHHRVHKHETLFEEVIVDLGLKELTSSTEISDLMPGPLPLKVYSIWKLIGLLKGNDPPEYLLIQFDDSWMDTLLKCSFFDRYSEDFMWSQDRANNPDWNRFDELISSQKHYYSVFKRPEDFQPFDELFFKHVLDNLRTPKPDDPVLAEQKRTELLLALDGIEEYNRFLQEKGSLFFHWIVSNTTLKVGILSEDREDLLEEIQDQFNASLNDKDKIQNIILRDCTFKLGCSSAKSKLFVSDSGEARPYQNFSMIEQLLKERKYFSLPVHLYFLPTHTTGEYPTDTSGINKEEDMFNKLVHIMWDVICKNTKIKEEENT